MRYIRTQIIITLVGLALVGGLLYFQALALQISFVPSAGGTYVEGVVGAPRRLNPLLGSQNPVDNDLARLIYAGLLQFGTDGLPVPDLAETWAVTADGLSYTFVLRTGLRWSDGVPLTLDDVIFTIELMQAPDFPGPPDVASLWRSVTVAKLNETTLKLTLADQPYAPFLDFATFAVLPAHLYHGTPAAELGEHPANLAPVGAGPFRLEEYSVVGGQIVSARLTANPHYHGEQPYLSQIRLVFYADEVAALAAFERDEIMALGGISPSGLDLFRADPSTNLFAGRLPEYRLILLNQQNESVAFFQEKKVRQALSAGLNRQLIVDEILRGQAIVASGPVLPDTWAYNPHLAPVTYEPERAVELLAAADWFVPETALPNTAEYVRQKRGRQLAFTLLVPDDPISLAIGELAVRNWADLGIQVTLQTSSPSSLEQDYLVPRQYEAMLISLSFARSPDPDPYPFWHQTEIESGQNYSGYDNRSLSELLEQARTTTSTVERRKLYQTFQARFADETPALLLYYPVYNYAVDARVRAVQMGPLLDPSRRFDSVADWYIVTRRTIVSGPGSDT